MSNSLRAFSCFFVLADDPEEPLVQTPPLLWFESHELPGLTLGLLGERLESALAGGLPRVLLPSVLVALNVSGVFAVTEGWQPLT